MTGADHNRHGRSQSQRTRTRDDKDRNRRDDGVGQGTEGEPDDESDNSDDDHCRHEPARHDIREPLYGRPRTLCFADHFDDLCQQRFAANAFGFHHKAAVGIDRPADHFASGLFLYRQRFAGDHRFVNRSFAVGDHAVGRHFLIRFYAKHVAGMDVFYIDNFFRAVGAYHRRLFRSQPQQFLDRRRSLRTSFQFQNLSEQYERRDNGGRFEISRHDARMRVSHLRREPSGHEQGGEAQ